MRAAGFTDACAITPEIADSQTFSSAEMTLAVAGIPVLPRVGGIERLAELVRLLARLPTSSVMIVHVEDVAVIRRASFGRQSGVNVQGCLTLLIGDEDVDALQHPAADPHAVVELLGEVEDRKMRAGLRLVRADELLEDAAIEKELEALTAIGPYQPIASGGDRPVRPASDLGLPVDLHRAHGLHQSQRHNMVARRHR